MSDLQAALLALGVVIIVTVLLYNKWQDARYRKSAERSFSLKHEDALVDHHQDEDEDEATSNSPTAVAATEKARIEPQYSELTPGTAPPSDQVSELQPARWPSSEAPIDYCVVLTFKSATESTRVIEAAVKLLSDFAKFIHMDVFDPRSESWRSIEHGEMCVTIRGSVQLVDRRGCIDPPQLERFDDAMRSLAEKLGAGASEDRTAEALARAKSIDQFCAEVDIKVGLNIISTEAPFSGEQVLAAAKATGLKFGADGGFHKRDGSGRSLFRLTNLDNVAFSEATLPMLKTRAITLEIDVPRTTQDPALVSHLFDSASQLAEQLGGRVVDDNHQAVGEQALASIRAQLENTYSQMTGRGFPAGDPLALRLFS